MRHTITYKPIPQNATLEIRVEELLIAGYYRVTIYEEYDEHILELTDINLHYYGHRRWLEDYIKTHNVKNVWFERALYAPFYKLEKYKTYVYNERTKKALNDLNI